MEMSPATIEAIAQTLFLVVAIIASAAGIQIGRNKLKKPDEGETHFELRGAVISDKKADEIVRCIDENTRVMRDKISAIKEFCHSVAALHETLKEGRQDNRDFLREFRADIRDLLRDIK